MNFFRKPSLNKSIAARTSIKRAIRSKFRAPKGFGWFTDPQKAAYNRVYNRTTFSLTNIVGKIVTKVLNATFNALLKSLKR